MRYRKLPIEIEAIQFTGENGKNIVDVYNFLEGTNAESQTEIKPYGKNFEMDFCNGTCMVGDIMIKTLEGDMRAKHGDYIIKGVNGEFYPCKPDIFEKTYEKADETITAESQAKHFNLMKIHVITQEDLDLFIQDGECTSLDDLEVSTTDFDWDFAQRALVDVDKNEIIIWNDNIHTDIDDDIDRFLDGITYVGNTYSLKEICLLESDMEQYEGVRYR